MILNISGRTDIVAFYTPWFINRYREGFVDVRNPFNKKLVSRINFSDVDLIFFCTKNPIPILSFLKKLDKPIMFHITITPYKEDIEPNIPPKVKIIEAVKKISKLIGKENISIRYDPVFLSDKYTVDYHIKAFDKLCRHLSGYVNKIVISFLDEYKNVKKNRNILNYRRFTEEDYEQIGKNFSSIATKYNISVQTCFEQKNLIEYGFIKGECLSHEVAYKLTGKTYKNWTARKEKLCNCVKMVDIGEYNTCNHLCKYCYANFDEDSIKKNMKKHNPKSSLLIGELESDDTIKIRRK